MKVSAVLALVVVALAAGGATPAGARSQSYSFVPVASGLVRPVYVTSAPGAPSTLYVVEQTGKIEIVRNGRIAGTFLDLTKLVSCCAERGLLSMAFSPDYRTNHLFFVSYTNVSGNSRVVQYSSADGVGVPASAKILLALHQPYANHKGGLLQFDTRGYLYIGFGDGDGEGDPNQTAQNMNLRLGKLLRSATTTPSRAWKIVALGLRNPWRYSFDPANDNLWLGDVGQASWEEIDFRRAAKLDELANYGWSHYEGDSVIAPSHALANAGQLVFPTLEYSHAHGCAVIGGYVYRGSTVPAAEARYFYGDACTSIWSFPVGPRGGRTGTPVVVGSVPGLSSFGVDGNGNLYAVSLRGTLYELR